MEKGATKVYRRKENLSQKPKSSEGIRKEIQRPRSRSVYTANSFASDEPLSLRGEIKPYEGSSWMPRIVPCKNYFIDEYNEIWHDDTAIGGCSISPHGVITLRLHDRVRVDISLDRSIRVVNNKSGIVLALSASGSSAALLHPNGRVYQYGSRVEILAHDAAGNGKYAKMWYKGVSFTSDQCALVYLVDSAGTRTTTDTFLDLSGDFSLNVFYGEGHHFDPANYGPHNINEAIAVLQESNYWNTDDGTDNWMINGIRISQTADGLVRIGRNSNKFSLRTSPSNGSASVSTPFLHCTGSMGQTRHLFVRRGERRMHYDGASFIVRNAGHSAGFDDKQQLKVY
ncbi:uncharacterized protein LOC108732336 isoform X2 [Agrilus planipennis]|uniref:Uncharacterized protein LOC108732336 isoform X2 n=1 Tax=Agrilus planipennis TaxID=224129 RepID=A0A1W4W347_AGRPL|nr:uncharacterized protein LOC108732336 isoform X2 [Agrilus planipennis]